MHIHTNVMPFHFDNVVNSEVFVLHFLFVYCDVWKIQAQHTFSFSLWHFKELYVKNILMKFLLSFWPCCCCCFFFAKIKSINTWASTQHLNVKFKMFSSIKGYIRVEQKYTYTNRYSLHFSGNVPAFQLQLLSVIILINMCSI